MIVCLQYVSFLLLILKVARKESNPLYIEKINVVNTDTKGNSGINVTIGIGTTYASSTKGKIGIVNSQQHL